MGPASAVAFRALCTAFLLFLSACGSGSATDTTVPIVGSPESPEGGGDNGAQPPGEDSNPDPIDAPDAPESVPAGAELLVDIDFTQAMLPPGATFERASPAYFRNHRGEVQQVAQNEAIFAGARREENLNPDSLSLADWETNGAAISQSIATPTNAFGHIKKQLDIDEKPGERYRYAVRVSASEAGQIFRLRHNPIDGIPTDLDIVAADTNPLEYSLLTPPYDQDRSTYLVIYPDIAGTRPLTVHQVGYTRVAQGIDSTPADLVEGSAVFTTSNGRSSDPATGKIVAGPGQDIRRAKFARGMSIGDSISDNVFIGYQLAVGEALGSTVYKCGREGDMMWEIRERFARDVIEIYNGGSSPLQAGDILRGESSGASATVTAVVLRSGTWETNNAEAQVSIESGQGSFEHGEAVTVDDLRRAGRVNLRSGHVDVIDGQRSAPRSRPECGLTGAHGPFDYVILQGGINSITRAAPSVRSIVDAGGGDYLVTVEWSGTTAPMTAQGRYKWASTGGETVTLSGIMPDAFNGTWSYSHPDSTDAAAAFRISGLPGGLTYSGGGRLHLNEIEKQIKNDFAALVDEASAHGIEKILLIGLMPYDFSTPSRTPTMETWMRGINDYLQNTLSPAHPEVTYINAMGLFEDPAAAFRWLPNRSDDGVHPSRNGYLELAGEVIKNLYNARFTGVEGLEVAPGFSNLCNCNAFPQEAARTREYADNDTVATFDVVATTGSMDGPYLEIVDEINGEPVAEILRRSGLGRFGAVTAYKTSRNFTLELPLFYAEATPTATADHHVSLYYLAAPDYSAKEANPRFQTRVSAAQSGFRSPFDFHKPLFVRYVQVLSDAPAGQRLAIQAHSGSADFYFVMPQLTQGGAPMPDLPTFGAAAAREADRYSDAWPEGLANGFSRVDSFALESAADDIRPEGKNWIWRIEEGANWLGVYVDQGEPRFIFEKQVNGVTTTATIDYRWRRGEVLAVAVRQSPTTGMTIFVNGRAGSVESSVDGRGSMGDAPARWYAGTRDGAQLWMKYRGVKTWRGELDDTALLQHTEGALRPNANPAE